MKKLLVANRGEIAVRIIRAARDLGIETVAVYAKPDAGTLHTRLADSCISLEGITAKDTYLKSEKIICAAIQFGADAIHPGYGFLSENAQFAELVCREKLNFVGPSPEIINLMGQKDKARECAMQLGVPVIPGGEAAKLEELKAIASKIGFPVMLKAVAGGSGRGMRIVKDKKDFEKLAAEAQREAESAFGNGRLIVEKYLERPRHIEVQVFGDREGNVIHFFERECSIQRRHQKLVEECPAPLLHREVRMSLLLAAVRIAKHVNYVGAGTIEFLVEGGEEEKSNFYFLEMNTRIQVEHPVTEEVTGIDLVRLQLEVAMGKPLPMGQEEVPCSCNAMEFRVYAENPANNFSPTGGEILYRSFPGGPGVREDTWIEPGTVVSPYFDALLSKVIVKGASRHQVLSRSKRVLHEFIIEGPETTLGFHRWLIEQEDFKQANTDVFWVSRNYTGNIVESNIVGPLEVPIKKNV